MKKILAFLLTATMLCALFVLPSAADDKVNYNEEISWVATAPSVDGVIKPGEYGLYPMHTYSESKEQFEDTEHNQYTETDFEFYAAWDADYIYMAWKVITPIHGAFPEKDYTGDGVFDDADSGYMWQYSCVQFIFTPGAPEAGVTTYQADGYTGNYLEVGLALTDAGKQVRVAWCKPTNAPSIDINAWDAVIVRDDAAQTTVYEVRIPWSLSGINSVGNGAKFGLTYAVAAQEDYNVKPGMIEWQDGVLGGKKADNAAVITLTGNTTIDVTDIIPSETLEEGTLPSEAQGEGVVSALIDGVDIGITGEKAYLYTDPTTLANNNTKWATCLLLAPVDGKDGHYTIAEIKTGAGNEGEVTFDSEITDGMIAFAAHSDGEGEGAARRDAVASLTVGQEVALFGVDLANAKLSYSNATLYTVASEGDTTEDPDDTSDDTSEDTSVDTSVDESEDKSEDESSESSIVNSEDNSGDDDGDSSSNWWIWVVIGVAVVAVVVVVVIVVSKKKK